MSQTAPEAGWYPDPDDAALLRWWDGVGWADHWLDADGNPLEVAPSGDADDASADEDGSSPRRAAFGGVSAAETSYAREVALPDGETILDPAAAKDTGPREWPWEKRPPRAIGKSHRQLYALGLIGLTAVAFALTSNVPAELQLENKLFLLLPLGAAALVAIVEALSFQDEIRKVRNRTSRAERKKVAAELAAAKRSGDMTARKRHRIRYERVEVTRPIPPSPLITSLCTLAVGGFIGGPPGIRLFVAIFLLAVATAAIFRFAVWRARSEYAYRFQLVLLLLAAAAGTFQMVQEGKEVAGRFVIDPRIAAMRIEVAIHTCVTNSHQKNYSGCTLDKLAQIDPTLSAMVGGAKPYVTRYGVSNETFTIATRDPHKPDSSEFTISMSNGKITRTCAPRDGRTCIIDIW